MGTVYQRHKDGRWAAAISDGPRSARRRVVRYAPATNNTEEAAGRLLDELVADARAGLPMTGNSLTVGSFLQQWLDNSVARSVRPSTRHGYEVVVRKHLTPQIGGIALARLSALDVEGLLNRLSRDLSPKSVRNVYIVLHRALVQGQRWDLVARNVAGLVAPPHVPRRESRAPDIREARALMAAVQSDRLRALWVTALETGLRQGELLGLAWSDVDLETATLSVRHQLAYVGGRYVRAEPKTDRSRRTIGLPLLAAEALREHRRRQLEERLTAGAPSTGDGLVFVTPAGRPISGSWLTHRFYRLCEEAGIPRYSFHALRHFATSVLVSQGAHPRIIMQTLGHSTTRTSMDIYAHVGTPETRVAANLVDAALAG
jgi:integrase